MYTSLEILLGVAFTITIISIIRGVTTNPNKEVNSKIHELEKLKTTLENNKVDNATKLPYIVKEVILMYEHSGIQLPYDIIEETSEHIFENKKEVQDFIENRRNYWTLENRKKPITKYPIK